MKGTLKWMSPMMLKSLISLYDSDTEEDRYVDENEELDEDDDNDSQTLIALQIQNDAALSGELAVVSTPSENTVVTRSISSSATQLSKKQASKTSSLDSRNTLMLCQGIIASKKPPPEQRLANTRIVSCCQSPLRCIWENHPPSYSDLLSDDSDIEEDRNADENEELGEDDDNDSQILIALQMQKDAAFSGELAVYLHHLRIQ